MTRIRKCSDSMFRFICLVLYTITAEIVKFMLSGHAFLQKYSQLYLPNFWEEDWKKRKWRKEIGIGVGIGENGGRKYIYRR